MSKDLPPYSGPPQADSATPLERADRNVERAALRDLVLLSAQCADEELQIDSGRQSDLQAEEASFREALHRIEQRRGDQEADIRRQYEERMSQVEQKFQSDMSVLNQSAEEARRQSDHERDVTTGSVREQSDKAVWLAETLLEGAGGSLREKIAKAEEECGKRLKDLDELEVRAATTLHQYGHSATSLIAASPRDAAAPATEEQPPSYEEGSTTAQRYLASLSSLWVPGLLVGAWPYVAGGLLCLFAAGVAQLIAGLDGPHWGAVGLSAAVSLAALMAARMLVVLVSRKQIQAAYVPLRRVLDAVRLAAKRELAEAKAFGRSEYRRAQEKCHREKQAASDRFGPMLSQVREAYNLRMRQIEADYSAKSAAIGEEHDRHRQRASERLEQFLKGVRQQGEADLRAAQDDHERNLARIEATYAQRRRDLENRWTTGLTGIQAPIEQFADPPSGQLSCDWSDHRWKRWEPPREFPKGIRFGEMRVDMKLLTDKAPHTLVLPESFSVAALLPFPRQSSLTIHTGHEGRARAIRTLQLVMFRLLTSVPPGRVRFTIIDPVGLGQNFAGFMHLADHDESLVGSRIWTEREHIEKQLADLTGHMETVIQKYLRNEFPTIDDYNVQAGEMAEPYRFLVVADFPTGFEADAFRRLASIATTGARCGVYVLLYRDVRQPLPPEAHLEELQARSVNLAHQGKAEEFVWKDDVFGRFPLTLDDPPDDRFIIRILDQVGRAALESKRVEVPFSTIIPPEGRFWSGSSRDGMEVPIGKMGATRFQSLSLGRGLAQHVIIAGKTGSGKSNLFHTIITNAAMWYPPEELEFYLVDFKKGVEFKSYVTGSLPHARAIAVESDREFGLSVLQRVDAELTRRGEMFRVAGVQDLPGYRQGSGKRLPRTLLIVDEFQEFFSEDDRISQESALLLDRLVRQGRAFGVHVILGSQTIGGTSGLSRSTMGQMAVRIALQCSEADSQLILGDNNSAARLLSRPGEAIYNDAGGLVEGNRPFQVAYLSDEQKEAYLAKVQELTRERGLRTEPAIVFEGNAPAAIVKNRKLMRLLEGERWPESVSAAVSWVGEPVAIKDPTAVAFRRQSGSNLLVIAQQEDSGLAVIGSSLVSLAAQFAPGAARFVILDGTPVDSPLRGTLDRVAAVLPHRSTIVELRGTAEAIHKLAEEMRKRQESDRPQQQLIFFIVYGLQRFRVLRRREDDFSMSRIDEEVGPSPDKQFAEILREGPAVGIHVIAWADTLVSVERTLDRSSIREFDNRVLFQMSASDSSSLIDSPLANKLGFYRAMFHSEELGIIEKLRPYALPSEEWLEYVRQRLLARGT